MVRGIMGIGVVAVVGVAAMTPPATPPRTGGAPADDVPLALQIFHEQVVNAGRIRPSTDLESHVGLKCRVHLHVGFSPQAGANRISEGTSFSGLRRVNDVPVGADGVLSEVDDGAIVVTGPNGHVWIPRDQVRAIEFLQNPSTAQDGD